MPTTQTQLRKRLMAVGLSESQAKKALKRFLRERDFGEICQLFAGDPTALVATLRAHGYTAHARYSKVAA